MPLIASEHGESYGVGCVHSGLTLILHSGHNFHRRNLEKKIPPWRSQQHWIFLFPFQLSIMKTTLWLCPILKYPHLWCPCYKESLPLHCPHIPTAFHCVYWPSIPFLPFFLCSNPHSITLPCSIANNKAITTWHTCRGAPQLVGYIWTFLHFRQSKQTLNVWLSLILTSK